MLINLKASVNVHYACLVSLLLKPKIYLYIYIERETDSTFSLYMLSHKNMYVGVCVGIFNVLLNVCVWMCVCRLVGLHICVSG